MRRNTATYDVDVAQLVEPEVMSRVGGVHEISIGHGLVDLSRSDVKFVEDPFLDNAFVASRLRD